MARKSNKPAVIDHTEETLRTSLLAIAAEHNDAVPPSAVVDAARDENSPLHDYFEWEDSTAAEAYRIIQARGLIRRVRLTLVRENHKGRIVDIKLTRQFQSRPTMRRPELGYEPIQNIIGDVSKRKEMVQQALAELEAIRARYEELSELGPIWDAIGRIKPKGKKAK